MKRIYITICFLAITISMFGQVFLQANNVEAENSVFTKQILTPHTNSSLIGKRILVEGSLKAGLHILVIPRLVLQLALGIGLLMAHGDIGMAMAGHHHLIA